MPSTWQGRSFYTREELAALTPEQRAGVLEAHRPLAYVREDELPPAYVEATTAEMVQWVQEREERQLREHRRAS